MFLSVEFLPYLLKALLFMEEKQSLSMSTVTFLDVVGYVAAGLILLLGASVLSRRNQLSGVVFFLGFIAAERAAEGRLLSETSLFMGKGNMIYLIFTLVMRILLAILLLIPAGQLFSTKVKCKRKGKILAMLLLLFSLYAAEIVQIIWLYLPFEDVVSIFSTAAYKMLIAFVETAFLTMGVTWLLKHEGEEKATKKQFFLRPALLFGCAFALFALVTAFSGNKEQSVTEAAKKDVELYFVQADLLRGSGDMSQVIRTYELAAEHCLAWQTLAEGESYELPEKYSDDIVLRYLSSLDKSTDEMRKYVATSLDEADIELWCPVMLERYKKQGSKLSEEEEEHQTEILNLCIAEECFTASYPGLKEIQKEKKSLKKNLKPSETYEEQMVILQVMAALQKGTMGRDTAIATLTDEAEKEPDNMMLQLFAGYITAYTYNDNTSNERTTEAILRYEDLWLDAYGKDATEDELVALYGSVSTLLFEIQNYEECIPVLEKALELVPNQTDFQQQLSFCYSSLDETEKGYELAKEIYKQDPENVSALWSYCIGALKNEHEEEAIEAASAMADIVRKDLGDNEDGIDQVFFNCVSYIAFNDDPSWTDYTYRIYDGENTDEDVLELLEENEFLYNYVQALYYEKQVKQPEEALEYVEEALDMQEKSGRLWYLKGIILYDGGEFDEAIEALLRADELEPDDPTILFAMANTYDALEEYRTAYALCQRIQEKYANGVDHSNDKYGISYHVNPLADKLKWLLEQEED